MPNKGSRALRKGPLTSKLGRHSIKFLWNAALTVAENAALTVAEVLYLCASSLPPFPISCALSHL
eukprot:1160719-Pelagomonas_calceolata.AAC.5